MFPFIVSEQMKCYRGTNLESENYKRYLENRDELHNYYVKCALTDNTKDRNEFGWRKKKHHRVLDAVKEHGSYELYQKLLECSMPSNHRYQCGSYYCGKCRKNHVREHKKRIDNQIANSNVTTIYDEQNNVLFEKRKSTIIDNSKRITNDDLLHITGVVGITSANKDACKTLIDNHRNTINKIRRNINLTKDVPQWVEWVYELELVSWKYLEHADENDYKKSNVKQLLEATGDHTLYNKPFMFIHYHGVTNIKRENIKSIFRNYHYHGNKPLKKTDKETGLYIQKLHKEKTLQINIQKISSYPFKSQIRYKHSYVGSDHSSGEHLTHEEINDVVTIHEHIKGSKKTRNDKLMVSISNNMKVWDMFIQGLTTLNTENKPKTRKTIDDENKLFCIEQTMKLINGIEKERYRERKIRFIGKVLRAIEEGYTRNDGSTETILNYCTFIHQHHRMLQNRVVTEKITRKYIHKLKIKRIEVCDKKGFEVVSWYRNNSFWVVDEFSGNKVRELVAKNPEMEAKMHELLSKYGLRYL